MLGCTFLEGCFTLALCISVVFLLDLHFDPHSRHQHCARRSVRAIVSQIRCADHKRCFFSIWRLGTTSDVRIARTATPKLRGLQPDYLKSFCPKRLLSRTPQCLLRPSASPCSSLALSFPWSRCSGFWYHRPRPQMSSFRVRCPPRSSRYLICRLSLLQSADFVHFFLQVERFPSWETRFISVTPMRRTFTSLRTTNPLPVAPLPCLPRIRWRAIRKVDGLLMRPGSTRALYIVVHRDLERPSCPGDCQTDTFSRLPSSHRSMRAISSLHNIVPPFRRMTDIQYPSLYQ